MAQQMTEKLVRIDFAEKEQKNLIKQVKREDSLIKMEEFLKKLNKEPKPGKIDFEKILKKGELNAKYLELTIPIHEIRYQQVHGINGIFR